MAIYGYTVNNQVFELLYFTLHSLTATQITVDLKKLEEGPGTFCAGVPFLSAFGLGDGHTPTFWLLQ